MGTATMLWRSLFADNARLLCFQKPSNALHTHAGQFLAFGLFWTWLAGVGRYWDNPRAHLWQHLGLGSLVYVFVLALLVWALVYPLRPRHWTYRNVLLFIVLTAPPALLYAIPVERFMSMEAARSANIWFLATVAGWRVALFGVFLHRVGGLAAYTMVIAMLLPLTLVVVALTLLNLEHVVFQIMGGLRDDQRSGNDGAYGVVVVLSLLSVYASPAVLLSYFVLVYRAYHAKPRSQPGATH